MGGRCWRLRDGGGGHRQWSTAWCATSLRGITAGFPPLNRNSIRTAPCHICEQHPPEDEQELQLLQPFGVRGLLHEIRDDHAATARRRQAQRQPAA